MLPTPAPEALAASAALRERIAAEISDHGGWIPFARYMELALYAPGLGYYAGGAEKLGTAGDFVTAPELGSLFGRTLARQVAELLPQGGELLEFGAGSGALAAALLGELDSAYRILETSAALRARQRARLGERAGWLQGLPERFRGVMLANEVLDAMPVHALAWRDAGVFERGVSESAGTLAWAERPAEGELLEEARKIDVPAPYESEIGLAACAWMRSVAARLDEGALLIIDYGFPRAEYYHPQRAMGTLMCHYRHRAHGDVFFHPGLQDITAHVDFSALAEAASEAGLEVLGYASQAQFLVNCGITEVLGQANAEQALHYAPLASEANKLLSPAEMGELFKVLAVGRAVKQPLLGFSRGDRSHTL
jgi:SAM-dependent MidA family methyltransferase